MLPPISCSRGEEHNLWSHCQNFAKTSRFNEVVLNREMAMHNSLEVTGYEYQASFEPNSLGCCTNPEDSSQAIGKVYSYGKLRGDAQYVNVVVNVNGVILTAYPSDQKLQNDRHR